MIMMIVVVVIIIFAAVVVIEVTLYEPNKYEVCGNRQEWC